VQWLTADRRLVFTKTDRRTIAEHAKAVGGKAARALLIVAALSTVRGWFRRLIAKPAKTLVRKREPGRPPISARVRKLVVRMAIDNPTWGYDRIADALGNLGIVISDHSVGNILKVRGIPSAGNYYYREAAQWGFTWEFEFFDRMPSGAPCQCGTRSATMPWR
jgi:putative transposase